MMFSTRAFGVAVVAMFLVVACSSGVPTESDLATTIESADGYAVPNGAVLSGETTPDEFASAIEGLAGPTENLAGDLSRFVPFPALSTLADTRVREFSLTASQGADRSDVLQTVSLATSVESDVVAATYAAELDELGFGPVTESSRERDGMSFLIVDAGAYSIVTYSTEDADLIEILYDSTLDIRTSGPAELFTEVLASSPRPADSKFERGTMSFLADRVVITVVESHELDVSQLIDRIAGEADDVGWTLADGSSAPRFEFETANNAATATVAISEVDGTARQSTTFAYRPHEIEDESQ